MSYIEIQIGEQKLNWQYNMAAAAEVLEELKSGNQLIQTYALVYAGLYGHAVFERKPCVFKWSDVVTMVDKMEPVKRGELILTLTEEYMRSQPPVTETEDKPKKKIRNSLPKKRSTKT